jgi:plasmid maintenance system antidote protein VapI
MAKQTKKHSCTEEELESMHPGKAIEAYMEYAETNTDELAGKLEIKPDNLQAIIRGGAGLSRSLMRRLARITDTPIDNWMEIQRRYEEALFETSDKNDLG